MEPKYITVQETLGKLDCSRATLYNYMSDLGIEPRKFPRTNKRYLTIEEVERIKEAREKPWLLQEAKDAQKNEKASQPEDKSPKNKVA